MRFAILNLENTPAMQSDLDRLIELWRANWDEALAEKHGDFRVDVQRILMAWKAKGLTFIVARDDAGKIQGYQLWTMGNTPIAPDRNIANMVAVYLVPEVRGTRVFPDFLDFGLLAMDAHGMTEKQMSVDFGSSMQTYLERKGFKAISTVLRHG